jgi:hypothetical protein
MKQICIFQDHRQFHSGTDRFFMDVEDNVLLFQDNKKVFAEKVCQSQYSPKV